MSENFNKKNVINLFKKKQNCCGCGACSNICPQKAIFMKEDKYGFIYPEIAEKKCIGCGICLKVCGYQNPIGSKKKYCAYAVVSTESQLYSTAASGGAFSVMAKTMLDTGGYVVGCSLEKNSLNQCFVAKHIIIHEEENIWKLQGSKYVQSDMGEVYSRIKYLLDHDKKILFSGTPCQTASLKQFLNKDYKKLITVDLICHGVPNKRMFEDYIKTLEKKYKMHIERIVFRDKTKGWGLNGYILGYKNRKKQKKIIFNNRESSYYYIFQHGLSYRKSCYYCPYAGAFRPGDITVGDYWGIDKEHPELFSDSHFNWNKENGISCVIVNSIKGKEFFYQCRDKMNLYPSTYDKIARNNTQLLSPTQFDCYQWKEIMENYYKNGYSGVEKWFRKQMGARLYKVKIKNRIRYLIKALCDYYVERYNRN